MRLLISFSSLVIFSGCSTNHNGFKFSDDYSEDNTELQSKLIINEYSPKSNTLNEFDEESDWIELYNSSDSVLEIEENSWSISDDRLDSDKYFIPACSIPSNGHLVIWCDGKNRQERDFHSNFKLSGNGEEIGLYYNGSLMDEITFEDDVKKNVSYGRINDGDEYWTLFKSPSPGTSNQSSDNYAEAIK